MASKKSKHEIRWEMLRIGDLLITGDRITDWKIYNITEDEIVLVNKKQESLIYHISEMDGLEFARII